MFVKFAMGVRWFRCDGWGGPVVSGARRLSRVGVCHFMSCSQRDVYFAIGNMQCIPHWWKHG